MDFQVFINRTGNRPDQLETMIGEISDFVDDVDVKTYDLSSSEEGNSIAEEKGIEETPSLLFNKVRISGAINEYFILACVAQLLTEDGDDQSGAEIELDEEDNHNRLRVASAFLTYQTMIREETDNYLFLIRSNTDEFNPDKLEEMANSGTTIYLLTNFEEGENGPDIASLGTHENILIGHILRDNIHATLSITVRKGRPFFGAYLRAKEDEEIWKGKWSPVLHDTVSELKDFYVPLFQTSSPVTLEGEIPEPMEVNRLVAKVKDNIEVLRALFF